MRARHRERLDVPERRSVATFGEGAGAFRC